MARQFLKDLTYLTFPFWRTKEAIWPGIYLFIATLCNLLTIFLGFQLSVWQRNFYNALQVKNFEVFWQQLGSLCILVFFMILALVNQTYLTDKAVLVWRRWLSNEYVDKWLYATNYYQETIAHRIDNPDQRIAEDLAMFPESTVVLILDFITSIGNIGTFSMILWNLSTSFSLYGIAIHGGIFWIAIMYVVAGMMGVHHIGHPLVYLKRKVQKEEANYRFSLVRVKESSKEISMYTAHDYEKQFLLRKFEDIFDVRVLIIARQRLLGYFRSGYQHISTYIPYLIVAPQYFFGTFGLGEMIQTAQAFNSVRANLSWFIANYGSLANWKATVDRIVQFDKSIRKAHVERGYQYSSIHEDIVVENVSMFLPNGNLLKASMNYLFIKGQKYCIVGPSGIGKSIFFATLRGLWPYATGYVNVPLHQALFLSQRSYIPQGSIRDVLLYPYVDRKMDDSELRNILSYVKLEHLSSHLGEIKNWHMVLSGGEVQRLALARIWVQKPQYVFMDESMSAIDIETRKHIMNQLEADFPQMTVISISHDRTESDFYDIVLSFAEL